MHSLRTLLKLLRTVSTALSIATGQVMLFISMLLVLYHTTQQVKCAERERPEAGTTHSLTSSFRIDTHCLWLDHTSWLPRHQRVWLYHNLQTPAKSLCGYTPGSLEAILSVVRQLSLYFHDTRHCCSMYNSMLA